MLKWLDVLKFSNNGNPEPDCRVSKTDEQWKSILTPEAYRITRQKGTEKAHSSDMCTLLDPGRYACVNCETPLFDSEEKFESGTGWPSFNQPIKNNAIAYHKDKGFGMYRIETVCNTCDAHLGHVFQDGPRPSGLRYCINAAAMKKLDTNLRKVTLGGGCFWCTEAIFQQLKGVADVKSGYSGGKVMNPTYREVTSGLTGHAEAIEITYNRDEISFYDLVNIHLMTHDPTTLNKQGADKGTQYRSIIFYRNDEERDASMSAINEVQEAYDEMIVTDLQMFEAFYEAEEYHQGYFNQNPTRAYCKVVIDPKLKKFKEKYTDRLLKDN